MTDTELMDVLEDIVDLLQEVCSGTDAYKQAFDLRERLWAIRQRTPSEGSSHD